MRNILSNCIETIGSALALRKRATAALVGVSPSTIDRMRKRGDFPAPIRVGEQAVAWLRSDIDEWLATRARAMH
ncbi:AlpA family transcriptional regulator [Variovorax sp. J22R115]|uniref:helix-turn-helix transcriptional regulator n=1 Tax=Variovorax sp. J22R115 TaxID=3053509 RepID=UPI0025781EDB|nr:AlpA family phage regulatory protein [Variovorax sp. J22R115]MDM0049295.1 AlpA family phage regulatory protein [Variovorax sp. J22R115]